MRFALPWSELSVGNRWPVLSKTCVSSVVPGDDNAFVSNSANTAPRTRPEVGREHAFIVQCDGYRCMAYRDAHGKWRDYFNNEEIKGEVRVVSAA
jgi:hypothetical protein